MATFYRLEGYPSKVVSVELIPDGLGNWWFQGPVGPVRGIAGHPDQVGYASSPEGARTNLPKRSMCNGLNGHTPFSWPRTRAIVREVNALIGE